MKLLFIITLCVIFVIEAQASDLTDEYCIKYPTATNCSTYVFPTEEITNLIGNFCIAIPNAFGCSINNYCEYMSSTKEYCAKFNIWKNLCNDFPNATGTLLHLHI